MASNSQIHGKTQLQNISVTLFVLAFAIMCYICDTDIDERCRGAVGYDIEFMSICEPGIEACVNIELSKFLFHSNEINKFSSYWIQCCSFVIFQ